MALLNWSGVDCMTIPYIPIKGEISIFFCHIPSKLCFQKGNQGNRSQEGSDISTIWWFLYINLSFFQIFGSFFGSFKADFLQNSGRPCHSWPRQFGSASQWMSSAMGLACRRDHRGLEVYNCYARCDKRHYRLDILETGRACTQQIGQR